MPPMKTPNELPTLQYGAFTSPIELRWIITHQLGLKGDQDRVLYPCAAPACSGQPGQSRSAAVSDQIIPRGTHDSGRIT